MEEQVQKNIKNLQFPDDYFDDEVRDGFLIKSMVKRAWAAQIEIIEDLKKVCAKHNIRFFADYGTLLGTIRHKGFIPWDDDIDIAMIREDYEKLVEVGIKDMPEGYSIYSFRTDPESSGEMVPRIVNARSVSTSKERMDKFHGFPYVAGIDIFVLDYISPNEDEAQLIRELIHIVLNDAKIIDDEAYPQGDKEYLLASIESLCGVTIDRNSMLRPQLLTIVDNLCRIYHEEEAKEITSMVKFSNEPNYRLDKSVYSDVIYMPFENILMPVPIGYEDVLTHKYGPEYMTPRCAKAGHDYPFYKEQEELVRRLYGYVLE